MTDLGERLARLGLAQYLDVFVSEGFDSWETVLDITESDLNALNVKLGHRRKLQRAIAEYRGQSTDRPLFLAASKASSVDLAYRSDDSAERPERPAEPVATGASGAPGAITKRKYRRHPRPDENAPDRPPSAYVIFSNQVREQLRGQDLSFTEIAKVVGERWQVLDPDVREACERQANAAKENYYKQLAVYKKTPEYEAYQKYLEDFKAKHGALPQKDAKRSKLDTESTIANSNSAEQTTRPSDRRISSVQADHYRSENSPLVPPGRLRSPPTYPSKPSSPALYPMSSGEPPRTGDRYSPGTASPHPTILHRESTHDFTSSSLGRDPRGQSDISFTSSGYGQTQPAPSTSPVSAYPGHYHPTHIDLPSRRTFRETTQLPPLTHEDTTVSSDSVNTIASPYSGVTFAPVLDPQKTMRVLPQPVRSVESSTSPLDRHIANGASSHSLAYPRALDALVRAGEMARADDEATEKPPDP